MAAPYKLHGGNSTTRSLHAWNECRKREYAKDVHGREEALHHILQLVQRLAGLRFGEAQAQKQKGIAVFFEKTKQKKALRCFKKTFCQTSTAQPAGAHAAKCTPGVSAALTQGRLEQVLGEESCEGGREEVMGRI